MEIKYLKKLELNPNLSSIGPRKGWNITQIEALEAQYNEGKLFPRAFREYLFLAGDFGNTGVVNEDWDWVRGRSDGNLKYFGYKLDRPYFVFEDYDSQYFIFYLDETDEDPIVYILDPFNYHNGSEPLVRRTFTGRFSILINVAITTNGELF
jgi:hypothetical protein